MSKQEKDEKPQQLVRATAKKVVRVLEEEIVMLNSVSVKKGVYGVRRTDDDRLNFRYGFICEDLRSNGLVFRGINGYVSNSFETVMEIIMTFEEFDFFQIG